MGKRTKLLVFTGMVIVPGTSAQRKAILAVLTRKLAAEFFNVSLQHFRDYFSITGNEHDKKIALENPYTIMYSSGPSGFVNPDERQYSSLPWYFRYYSDKKLSQVENETLFNEGKETLLKIATASEQHRGYYIDYMKRIKQECSNREIPLVINIQR